MGQIKSYNTSFLIVSVFLGVVTTLLHYSFGNNDHIEQLPIIYRTLDADYLTNDFFVNSNAGFSPRYYYSKLVSFFGSFMGTPLFFLIGTLLSNIAISVLTFINAKILLNDQKTAVLAAAAIMLIPTIHLGGDLLLFGSMFTPTTLVFPLVLLAFYFFLKGKMTLCFVTTGVISIFHILIGFEYGMLFLFTWILVDFLKDKSFVSILKKLPFLALIIAFLLPNLIPYFETKIAIDSTTFIEILAHFRHPHHYVLSEILTLEEILKLLGIIAIIILSWKAFAKRIQNKEHQKAIGVIGVLLVGAVFLNWIFIELIPIKEVTSLQLLRLLNFGKWIFILLFITFISQSFLGKEKKVQNLIICFLVILLLVFAKISYVKFLIQVIVFGVVLQFLFTNKRKLLLVSIPLVITGGLILNSTNISFLQPYQKQYVSTSGLSESQRELSNFIQSKTNEKATFLAPHLFGFLRTEAKRAIVVDFKAFPFQEDAMQEWYRRIEDCYGLDKDLFEAIYKSITDRKLLQLQQQYAFDYAVLYAETPTKIPTIYSNSEYKIIDLASYAQ